jgi:glycine reductase complex component B subunit alpha and beta
MRLELRIHQVQDVRLAATTGLDGGVLSIDGDRLRRHLLDSDDRLADVTFDCAHPGDRCRITSIADIVEPRVKVDGGVDFPGVLGSFRPAGTGVTAVLRGVAATILNPEERPGGRGAVLDMSGSYPEGWSAQDISVYAGINHLVIIPHLAAGVTGDAASHTLRFAVLRAAVWMAAEAARGEPDGVEVFELDPVPAAKLERLPTIVYVCQIHSHQRPTVAGEPLLYGDNVRHLLPVTLHPNEILDGAVLQGYNARGTYILQNHPVILELYRRHGVDLAFGGVVAVVAHQTAEERERCAMMSATLVKHVLRADGAVFTKTGGGAPHVDMAEMAHRCEQMGVRTSLVAWETSGTGEGQDGSALFNHADLDAVVNVGSNGYRFSLPAMERIITPWEDPDAIARMLGSITVTAGQLCGALEQFGGGRFSMALY